MKRFLRIVALASLILSSIGLTQVAAQPKIKYIDASAFPLYGKVDEYSQSRYERLPQVYEGLLRAPLWTLSRNSAGLSIRFRSNSSSIHVKWVSTFKNSMRHMTDIGTRGLDLYALDSGVWRHVCSAFPNAKENENSARIISGMSSDYREYMLYLSLYDGVSSLEIGVDEDSEILLPQVNSPSREYPVVMYGTSIMQGCSASRPGMAHPNIISRAMDREVINLGFSGNALLDLKIAEYMAKVESPGVYVLDYVPNASVSHIDSLGVAFFDILRSAHPSVPIIFVEDPSFPSAHFNQALAQEVKEKNEAQKRLYDSLVERGEKRLYYVDTDNLIGDDGEGTVDGIHFTDLGSGRYVQKLLPIIKQALFEREY